MSRQPSASEAETLDLILKNEARAREYEAMTDGSHAKPFAEAGWPLGDLVEVCRATAGLARAILEREGWEPADIAEALTKRSSAVLKG